MYRVVGYCIRDGIAEYFIHYTQDSKTEAVNEAKAMSQIIDATFWAYKSSDIYPTAVFRHGLDFTSYLNYFNGLT